jgi:hypothetical protein
MGRRPPAKASERERREKGSRGESKRTLGWRVRKGRRRRREERASPESISPHKALAELARGVDGVDGDGSGRVRPSMGR